MDRSQLIEILSLEPGAADDALLATLRDVPVDERKSVLHVLRKLIESEPRWARCLHAILGRLTPDDSRGIVRKLCLESHETLIWFAGDACVRTTRPALVDWLAGTSDRLLGTSLAQRELEQSMWMIRERRPSISHDSSRTDGAFVEVPIPVAGEVPLWIERLGRPKEVWSQRITVTPDSHGNSTVRGGVRLDLDCGRVVDARCSSGVVIVLESVGSRLCFPARLIRESARSLAGEIEVSIPHAFRPMDLDRRLLRATILDSEAIRDERAVVFRRPVNAGNRVRKSVQA
ncbi:MAG: hypothetical protein IT457_12435 [Planctomycetes bacterium]|nr:hypothetical protein [Planctomycetota bacterium]